MQNLIPRSTFLRGIFAMPFVSHLIGNRGQAGAIQPAQADEGAGLIARIQSLERMMESLSQDFGIGTIIFSTNESPPSTNWAACDGISKFGNDPHVPEKLRGTAVPSLKDACVAVGENIGERVEGLLVAQAVNGGSFELPTPSTARIADDAPTNVTHPHFKGGMVAVMTANPDYTAVKDNVANWKCHGGLMDPSPANYKFHPGGTKVLGVVEIKPPTHTFLRAYIKIR